jgi:alpha-tubulin suppressor-like RCC1 family protein
MTTSRLGLIAWALAGCLNLERPRDVPRDATADVPRDVPPDRTVDVPVDAARDALAVDVPADLARDAPPDITRDVPADDGCGRVCTFPHAEAACVAGSCVRGRCQAGFDDCNGVPSDGCEVELNAATGDPNHCGRCGNRCPTPPVGAMSVCRAGRCEFAVMCPSGLGDCDGVTANGCETTIATSVSHCGACGRACSAVHGTPVCTAGACRITCEAGFADCNANVTDGCEVALNATEAHCGACGRACLVGPCVGGSCLAFAELATGALNTCARMSDGTVWCWGSNAEGELGVGTTSTVPQTTPTRVPGLMNVAQIALGVRHACALLTDGTARCWGQNLYGQLGDGTTTDRPSPVAVPGVSAAVQLSLGERHTCARMTDGTVRCWGFNNNGQLGDRTTTSRNIPGEVPGLTGAVQIELNYYFGCARLDGADGTAQCWGYGAQGQLGNGSTNHALGPTTVMNATTITQLSLGGDHACGRTSAGNLLCWGDNSQGQLGDGTTTRRTTATSVPGLSGVTRVALGYRHTCAQMMDGAVRCWGNNSFGQLGDGTTTSRMVPAAVSGLSGVAQLHTRGSHACVRLTNGTARCWGQNTFGQLGDGSTTHRAVPTAVMW